MIRYLYHGSKFFSKLKLSAEVTQGADLNIQQKHKSRLISFFTAFGFSPYKRNRRVAARQTPYFLVARRESKQRSAPELLAAAGGSLRSTLALRSLENSPAAQTSSLEFRKTSVALRRCHTGVFLTAVSAKRVRELRSSLANSPSQASARWQNPSSPHPQPVPGQSVDNSAFWDGS